MFVLHEWVAEGISVAQLCLEAGSRHLSAAADVPRAAPGSVAANGASQDGRCREGDSALQGIACGELGLGLTVLQPSFSYSLASKTT